MREWLRARWRYVAAGLALVLAIVYFLGARIRDSLVARRDARTDSRLDRSHEAHESHEARADELERRAEEARRDADTWLTNRRDYSNMSSEEIVERFKQIQEQRKRDNQ